MRDIFSLCKSEGYFSYNDMELTLSSKKPKYYVYHNSSSKLTQPESDKDLLLMPYLKKRAESYLEYLSKLFSTEIDCCYCKKHLMFDSKSKVFEPPFIRHYDYSKDIPPKTYH